PPCSCCIVSQPHTRLPCPGRTVTYPDKEVLELPGWAGSPVPAQQGECRNHRIKPVTLSRHRCPFSHHAKQEMPGTRILVQWNFFKSPFLELRNHMEQFL